MKKFQKSPNCHRCMINYVCETSRCKHCNLALCFSCHQHYTEVDKKYQIKVINLPYGIEIICYNCRESQRVMNKIDCWLAVHGSDK